MSRASLAGPVLVVLALTAAALAFLFLLPESTYQQQGIIGGESSPKGQFPSIALVQTRTVLSDTGTSRRILTTRCGGSLVAPTWVLTAAHCTYRTDEKGKEIPIAAESFTASLGRLKVNGKDGEDIKVTEVVRHPGYNSYTTRNDLALLRLAKPSQQPPIQIIDSTADADLLASGKDAYIAGWGVKKLTPKEEDSDDLLYTIVGIKSDAECTSALQKLLKSTFVNFDGATQICAGGEKNIDSCPGDSGGPLMVRRPGGPWMLAGVVSYSLAPVHIEEPCGVEGSPGIYADPAALRSFIEQTLTKGGIFKPSQPSAVLASRASANAIDVSWLDNSSNELRFTVGSQASGSIFFAYYTVPADALKKRIAATPGKSYSIILRACNNAGCSDWTKPVSVN